MKKLFTIMSALVLAVSMWGESFYDCYINSDVTLTDLSYELLGDTVYKYQLDFAQKSKVRGSTTIYDATTRFVIFPETADIAGTFSVSNYGLDKNDSYVHYASNDRKPQNDAAITITNNGNGTYTLSGNMKVGSSNTWNYYFNDVDNDPDNPKNTFTPVAPDPYQDEPAKRSSDISFNGNSLFSKEFDNPKLILYITDPAYNAMEIQFNVTKDTLEAKTYTVGTDIEASTGMEGYWPIPTYYTNSTYNYFVVSGSLSVSYSQDLAQLMMTGTLTSAHGTSINVNITIDNPWYVVPTAIEHAKAQPITTIKQMVDGQVVIKKNAKQYTITGAKTH